MRDQLETIYENQELSANQQSRAFLELYQGDSQDLIEELGLYEMPDYEAAEVLFYHLSELEG